MPGIRLHSSSTRSFLITSMEEVHVLECNIVLIAPHRMIQTPTTSQHGRKEIASVTKTVHKCHNTPAGFDVEFVSVK
jgi:hypothetical protein